MTKHLSAIAKLQKLKLELNDVFIKRESEIDLILIANLAKEHLFLGGPPGTGKTALSKAVAQAIGGTSFYYLMTATTTTDEILGPVDIKKLNQGVYERDLSRGIAAAETVILDEGFKANSICLNALLGLILDREIVNNGKVVTCPLNSLVVCSNELPQEESLAPFWDRIALRKWVANLHRRDTRKLMARHLAGKSLNVATTLSDQDLIDLRTAIEQVKVSKEIINLVTSITFDLKSDLNLETSTRKHIQLLKLLKTRAVLFDRTEVTEEDLTLLQYVLWNDLEQIPQIKESIKKFEDPSAKDIERLLNVVKQLRDELQPFDRTKESRGNWMNKLSSRTLKIEEAKTQMDKLVKQYPQAANSNNYAILSAAFTAVEEKIEQIQLEAYSNKATSIV